MKVTQRSESLAIKIEVKASVGGEVERFDRQLDLQLSGAIQL